MEKELPIIGTSYVINTETMAVYRPAQRYPVQVLNGVVRLYIKQSRHKFTPKYLLECATKGIAPVTSQRKCKKAEKPTDKSPWGYINRIWSDNGGKGVNYYVKVLPHVPVNEMRTGLESQGITWNDPIVLGIGAPLVRAA